MERLKELKREVAAQEQKLKSLQQQQLNLKQRQIGQQQQPQPQQLQEQLEQQQQNCSGIDNNNNHSNLNVKEGSIVSVSAEQDAINALIFMKEKELALALMKVAELTSQLECLKGSEAMSMAECSTRVLHRHQDSNDFVNAIQSSSSPSSLSSSPLSSTIVVARKIPIMVRKVPAEEPKVNYIMPSASSSSSLLSYSSSSPPQPPSRNMSHSYTQSASSLISPSSSFSPSTVPSSSPLLFSHYTDNAVKTSSQVKQSTSFDNSVMKYLFDRKNVRNQFFASQCSTSPSSTCSSSLVMSIPQAECSDNVDDVSAATSRGALKTVLNSKQQPQATSIITSQSNATLNGFKTNSAGKQTAGTTDMLVSESANNMDSNNSTESYRRSTSSMMMSRFAPRPYSSRSKSVDSTSFRRPSSRPTTPSRGDLWTDEVLTDVNCHKSKSSAMNDCLLPSSENSECIPSYLHASDKSSVYINDMVQKDCSSSNGSIITVTNPNYLQPDGGHNLTNIDTFHCASPCDSLQYNNNLSRFQRFLPKSASFQYSLPTLKCNSSLVKTNLLRQPTTTTSIAESNPSSVVSQTSLNTITTAAITTISTTLPTTASMTSETTSTTKITPQKPKKPPKPPHLSKEYRSLSLGSSAKYLNNSNRASTNSTNLANENNINGIICRKIQSDKQQDSVLNLQHQPQTQHQQHLQQQQRQQNLTTDVEIIRVGGVRELTRMFSNDSKVSIPDTKIGNTVVSSSIIDNFNNHPQLLNSITTLTNGLPSLDSSFISVGSSTSLDRASPSTTPSSSSTIVMAVTDSTVCTSSIQLPSSSASTHHFLAVTSDKINLESPTGSTSSVTLSSTSSSFNDRTALSPLSPFTCKSSSNNFPQSHSGQAILTSLSISSPSASSSSSSGSIQPSITASSTSTVSSSSTTTSQASSNSLDISANAVNSALSILMSGSQHSSGHYISSSSSSLLTSSSSLSSSYHHHTSASRPTRLFGYSSNCTRPKFPLTSTSFINDQDNMNSSISSDTDDDAVKKTTSSTAKKYSSLPSSLTNISVSAPTIYSLFSPPPKTKLSIFVTSPNVCTSTSAIDHITDNKPQPPTTSTSTKLKHLLPLSYITLSSDLFYSNTNTEADKVDGGTSSTKKKTKRRVTFDPNFIFMNVVAEGELELVRNIIPMVTDPDRSNDNGMTALHVAVCGLHVDVVKFLLQYGCNVNAVNNDNWTPLHYAALNSRKDLVEMLVEHGSCVYALTSDHQTPHDKCQPNEECAKVLKDYEHQLGHVNNGLVYCMVGYQAEQDDELTVHAGEMLRILKRGDEMEKEGWWWARRVTEHGWDNEGGGSEELSHKSTTTATSIIDIDDVADVDHVEDVDDCSGFVAAEHAGSATMGRHVEGSVARSIIAVYKKAPKKWI